MAKHTPRPTFYGDRLICLTCKQGLRGQSAPVLGRWFLGEDERHVVREGTLFRPTRTAVKTEVAVAIPGTLWDTVVDSIGQDQSINFGLNLTRGSDLWAWRKAGFGRTVTATVPTNVAGRIADYLESLAGLMGQSFAMDPEDRASARRESSAAGRAAKAIRAQL